MKRREQENAAMQSAAAVRGAAAGSLHVGTALRTRVTDDWTPELQRLAEQSWEYSCGNADWCCVCRVRDRTRTVPMSYANAHMPMPMQECTPTAMTRPHL